MSTIKEIQKLGDAKLLMKVAEFIDGWKKIDYVTNLNAMYEAESYACKKDEHWAEKWFMAISLVLSNGETDDYANVGKWDIAHATARQRAEAFVLAMEM